MSRMDTNEIVVDEIPEEAVETATIVEEPASKPKAKKIGNRIFAFLILALSVAFLILPVGIYGVDENASLLTTMLDLFKSESPTFMFFNALPALVSCQSFIGTLATFGFYVGICFAVVGAVYSLITVLFGNPVRTATFMYASGVTTFFLCNYLADSTLDIITLAFVAIGVILYLALAFKKNGACTFKTLLQAVLSTAVFFMSVLIMKDYKEDLMKGIDSLSLSAQQNVITYAILGILAFSALCGGIRLQRTKGKGFDVFRYILQLLVGIFLCVMAFTGNATVNFLIYSTVTVVVSLLQLLLSKKRKVKEAPVEEPVVEENFVVEEYAEALPYEGGPVEGVEIAEEVVPSFEEQYHPPVQTAGYDFYNCKSFDPFIASLNNEERNDFTEIFILKYRGPFNEIPDYVVGGDNKEFFRKIFIYLGQYRDRLPDSLLTKIYQFAIKIS